jgi:hypothetical protein
MVTRESKNKRNTFFFLLKAIKLICLDHFSGYMETILLKPVNKGDVRYAYPLQFVSHPSPSPGLLIDAQGESTFLLVEVTDTPFVLMQPRESS